MSRRLTGVELAYSGKLATWPGKVDGVLAAIAATAKGDPVLVVDLGM